MDAPQAVHNLCTRGVLGELLRQAAVLRQAQTAVDHALPDALRGQVMIAGLDGGVLAVVVASAAYALRLRFFEPALIAALRDTQGFAALRELRVRVAPPPPPARRAAPPPRPAGAAARIVRGAAQAVEDAALRQALERLADALAR